MVRLAVIVLLASASACGGPAPVSTDMCEAPRNFGGWQGVEVHWKGAVLDASPHAVGLVATGCKSTGILIADLPPVVAKALERAWGRTGITHIEVEGKITPDRSLRINKVRSIEFEAMSQAERDGFWQSLPR